MSKITHTQDQHAFDLAWRYWTLLCKIYVQWLFWPTHTLNDWFDILLINVADGAREAVSFTFTFSFWLLYRKFYIFYERWKGQIIDLSWCSSWSTRWLGFRKIQIPQTSELRISILNLKNPTFPNNCISWDPQICQWTLKLTRKFKFLLFWIKYQ